MKVDVIMVLQNGIVTRTEVVEDQITAESTFDTVVEDLGLDSIKDITNQIDYAFKLEDVNNYLKGMDMEILWQTGLEVNTYKNY